MSNPADSRFVNSRTPIGRSERPLFSRQGPVVVILMCGDPDPGRFFSDLGRAIGNFFHDHFSSVVYEYPTTILKKCDYVYLGNLKDDEKADIEITDNQEADPKSPSDYGAVEIFVEPAATPVPAAGSTPRTTMGGNGSTWFYGPGHIFVHLKTRDTFKVKMTVSRT